MAVNTVVSNYLILGGKMFVSINTLVRNDLILGDKLVDQSEYLQVMGYFDISRSEAIACFDKFALVLFILFIDT